MSIKQELERVVQLQALELDAAALDRAIQEIEEEKLRLEARIEEAEAKVEAAEAELEACQKEIRSLEMELQTAEQNVRDHKDKIHEVKTNKELWALQEEIGRAEREVGKVEERSILAMERADEIAERIEARRRELAETRARTDQERAAADLRAQEVAAERERVEATAGTIAEQLDDDVQKQFEEVKSVRAGLAVAEAFDGVCLACNVTMRPQLLVEVRNANEIQRCENCKRILFERESLDLPAGLSLDPTRRSVVDGEPQPPHLADRAEEAGGDDGAADDGGEVEADADTARAQVEGDGADSEEE